MILNNLFNKVYYCFYVSDSIHKYFFRNIVNPYLLLHHYIPCMTLMLPVQEHVYVQ